MRQKRLETSTRQADGGGRREKIPESLVMLRNGAWDGKCHLLSAMSRLLREIKPLENDPVFQGSDQPTQRMTNPFAIRLSNNQMTEIFMVGYRSEEETYGHKL